MPSESVPTRCVECGRTYHPSSTAPHRCTCGGCLDLESVPPPPSVTDGPITGLADIATSLPGGELVDIGAGGTPSVAVSELDAKLWLETCNPTGSFKDRGAAVTVSRAVAAGATRIKEDSSGNAGLAIAAHAARAGLDASIFVPADAAGSTLAAIEATGAEVVPVSGTRADVATACEAADAGWYASHAWRPSFYAGTATLAYELVAARGGKPPDAIVLPVGHGTLLLGLYRGFTRLHNYEAIDHLPRLFAAQLRDAGSLVGQSTQVDGDLAPGIRIEAPAREAQVREAIEQSGGGVVQVDPAAISPARDSLARLGFDACTTAAVATVARTTLEERETVHSADDAVVIITGRARDR